MPTPDLGRAQWRKSTLSENSTGCVEIAHMDDVIAVRDSKNPDGPILIFTPHEWECFLDGVSRGKFSRPT